MVGLFRGFVAFSDGVCCNWCLLVSLLVLLGLLFAFDCVVLLGVFVYCCGVFVVEVFGLLCYFGFGKLVACLNWILKLLLAFVLNWC